MFRWSCHESACCSPCARMLTQGASAVEHRREGDRIARGVGSDARSLGKTGHFAPCRFALCVLLNVKKCRPTSARNLSTLPLAARGANKSPTLTLPPHQATLRARPPKCGVAVQLRGTTKSPKVMRRSTAFVFRIVKRKRERKFHHVGTRHQSCRVAVDSGGRFECGL